MDYIIVKTEQNDNWYRFYPTEQPDGEHDVDHHRVWIDPRIRADYSDKVIVDMFFVPALARWIAGEPMPFEFGTATSVSIRDDGAILLEWPGGEGGEW